MNNVEQLMYDLRLVLDEKERLTDQMNAIKKKESAIKDQLQTIMESRNITSLENARLSVTYINGYDKCSADLERLKKEYPEVAARCIITKHIAPFVKVRWKE